VIFDLEDSVAPEKKAEARENLSGLLSGKPLIGKERIIRINGLSSNVGPRRHGAGTALEPDAVLLPKVDEPQDVMSVSDLLADADAPDSLRIWAMIETRAASSTPPPSPKPDARRAPGSIASSSASTTCARKPASCRSPAAPISCPG
jgi:citrate lyase beta subunit